MTLSARAADPADFSAVNAALRALPEMHSMEADDGTKLVYSVVPPTSSTGPFRPVIIVEGRGESAFRYVEIIEEMQEKGFGPFYILDHRNQGFSEQEILGAVHSSDFNLYAKDLVKFGGSYDGPVQKDLRARGITEKPLIIAHSAGTPVINKAFVLQPDLGKKVVYIAPMNEINLGPTLERFHNKPIEILTSAMRGLRLGKKVYGPTVDDPKTLRLPRMAPLYAQEQLLNVRTPQESFSWINEALKAGTAIRTGVIPPPPVATLIFTGRRDQVVNNAATMAFACKTKSCTVVDLDGGHSLHNERKSIRSILVDHIDKFDRDEHIPNPGTECGSLYRVLYRSK